jgi:hypothetical protein
MNGSVERLGEESRSVGARDMKLTRYTYGVPGVDITIWADDQGNLPRGGAGLARCVCARWL